IVTASDDKTAQVWKATSGQRVGGPLRHVYSVLSAQFSPDGARVVTASADKTAQVWKATSGQRVGGPLRHEETVSSAQFSPDGSLIVTTCVLDNTARVWKTAT